MPARQRRVAIRTLGCKVNRSESEALAEALAPLGVFLAGEGEAADAIVVNTCTVTAEADAKARKEVRRALAATDGPVYVTGCLAALDADGLRDLDGRVVVFAQRSGLADTIADALDAVPTSDAVAARHPGARTRALVKIQDGCDNRCAYCIVPDARGVPRSVPADEVVDRVQRLHEAGTAEVVLTGINIGRYDDAGADLADLVERIARTGIRRIRISSIEPPDLTDRLLRVIEETPAVAPHLHVPLQSGCDATLSAMGRRYDTSGFRGVLDRARRAVPSLVVTTDVIAGFPGETDDDFERSLAFVQTCGFAKLHVFRYSRREGTPAAADPAQVPPQTKSERARRLRELDERLVAVHVAQRVGERAMLLLEVGDARGGRGTTEDYLHVHADLPDTHVGQLVPVVLRTSDDGTLRAYHDE